MLSAFQKALSFALLPEHDGQGYHVTPGDTGGPTSWGIIKSTLAQYRGVPVSTISNEDIKALTRESVAPIYEKLFWQKFSCHKMPGPIGLMAFDFSVTSGKWSLIRLQRLVRVAEDGAIGPKSLAAIDAMWAVNPRYMVQSYGDARMHFYKQIPGHEHWPGWFKRSDRCTALALSLLSELDS